MKGASAGVLALALLASAGDGTRAQPRAPGAAATQEGVEGWLYFGRRSEGAWRPAAPSIAQAPWPLKPGTRIALAHDALFYSAVDCRVTPLESFGAGPAALHAERTWIVSAEGGPLEVIGAPVECPSVCGARTVWAPVRIPAARLVAVEP
jgi:hypothetical protein